jgi:hypothetical protein
MENVIDHLEFLSTTQCDIFTELEFIALHFCHLIRPDPLRAMRFSVIYVIINCRSLRLESEDSLMALLIKAPKQTRQYSTSWNSPDWNVARRM